LGTLLLSSPYGGGRGNLTAGWGLGWRHLQSTGVDRVFLLRDSHITACFEGRPVGGVKVQTAGSQTAEARRQRMIDGLAEDVCEVLRLSANRLDRDMPLTDMGVDSLMMVEVQLAIERRVGLNVPLLELSQGISVSKLAEHLLARLAAEAGLSAGLGTSTNIRSSLPSDAVDDMSDAEVEALLNTLLQDETAIGAQHENQ
jgi:acyl carrier protein